MSQPSAATSSFSVVCPGCGQRLRFTIGADTPPRVRIRCSICLHEFGVKRPGADQGDVTVAGASPPTLVGTPVAASAPAPPRSRDEPAFSPGEVIAGRYRVVRFLARGGMGEVYEVEDQELRDRVALKTIRGDVSRDATAVERFRREIQLARKVTHPHVCRIFDVSFHGGLIFLTMELLEGETLAQRLRRSGPMSTEEALPIARQIAWALQAAHQAGIVHRDLKPGNVVLAESKGSLRAVVTDFGLARLESGEDAMTLTAQAGVVGTPAYLAPEQVEGKEITGAVDVYALGIVLYEMLTGTVPFVGDTALSVAVRRLQERPASPRVHVPGLDARWEAAILRCLERDPAARFASAPDVIQALTKSEETPAAVPPPPPPPAKKSNKVQLIALAALLLLAVGIGAFRYLGWRAEQNLTPEQRLARLTEGIQPRRSVAVLGFQNLTGTPGTEWLSAGIAEMLATELGAGGGLRIVPGENVARAKVELGLGDSNSLASDTLSRVRTRLATDAVVLGSFAILKDKIRLDVRLQDTVAGETITVAETGPESELFEVVARAGRRLREEMGAGEADSKVRVASSTDAARFYSEGMNRLRLFEPAAARDLLERAVAADPRNALARSGLASALTALGYDGRARDEAKAAFELSADLPPEDRLLIEARYREANQEWRRAVQIHWELWSMFPDDLDHGLRLAAAQTAAGQVEEALATAEALRELPPPSNEDPRIDLAEALAAGARADFQRQRLASESAAAKASAQNATLMVAQARLMQCRALRNLGQAEPALAACAEGQRLFAAKGDQAGVAEALTHAANVRFDRGEPAEASRLYDEALATYRAIGSRGAEAGALNNIAVVLRSQGDLDRAAQLYEQVLGVTREIGSKAGEAYALNNLAGVLLRRGKLDESGKLFEQALAIRREQGDKSGEAYALDNLGVVLRRKGELAGARQKHDLALRLRKETGQKIGEVASLNNLGTLALDQGDLAAARKSFESSHEICKQTGSQSSRAYALFGLGEVLAREGKLDEARRSHEEALALREKLGEKGTAAESRLALAILSLEQGDRAKAIELAGQAAEELKRQGATDSQALALAVAGQGREALALLEGSQDLRARLAVQLRASSSRTVLEEVLDQATRAGFTEIRLEAALALKRPVEKEAREKGYLRIAGKASA